MNRTKITINVTVVGPLLTPQSASILILTLHWLGFL